MLAGIRDILIITTSRDHDSYVALLGDGARLGVNFQYVIQPEPAGLAQAFILGEEFIGSSSVVLILGDNVFYGGRFPAILRAANESDHSAQIFTYRVGNPQDFGVVEFDYTLNAISIEEKPENPKLSFVVSGLYFNDNSVIDDGQLEKIAAQTKK